MKFPSYNFLLLIFSYSFLFIPKCSFPMTLAFSVFKYLLWFHSEGDEIKGTSLMGSSFPFCIFSWNTSNIRTPVTEATCVDQFSYHWCFYNLRDKRRLSFADFSLSIWKGMCKFWYCPLVKDEFESHYSNGIEHITRAFQNIWIFGPSR